MIQTFISTEIDLSDSIEMLSEGERLQWISALLETIREEGTIDEVRALVNDPRWNDQSPA